MIDALIQFVGLFLLQETYPPVLLQRRKARLINETGNNDLHTEWDDPDRTLATTLKIAFTRPFILLFTQPIVQVLALYMAFIYGTIYLVLSTFPTLWTGKYGESIGIGGLNYISLGVGFFLGTQICAPCQDRIYRAMKKRNNGVGKPEFRVPLMIPGSLFVPAGLFIYGWTAQAKTHWIFPNSKTSVILQLGKAQCTDLVCSSWSRAVRRRYYYSLPMHPNLHRRRIHSLCGICYWSCDRVTKLSCLQLPSIRAVYVCRIAIWMGKLFACDSWHCHRVACPNIALEVRRETEREK